MSRPASSCGAVNTMSRSAVTVSPLAANRPCTLLPPVGGKGMRCAEERSGFITVTSSQVAYDVRAERVGCGLGQSPPQRDERAILRVERVVLRYVLAFEKLILVSQRRGFDAPILLEVERAGPSLAAAEIE